MNEPGVDVERLQREHYDRIAHRYAQHYGDAWSQRYRDRFFHAPMLQGIELSGARVLEAMCGSGETTGYLLEQGAQVTGVDISETEVDAFRKRWPGAQARRASILDTQLPDGSFDCVVVVGGLHHVHPHVERAIDEIHRVLRPGGHFCFVEPHAGSLPDRARRIWYRRDRLFAANEEALDVAALKTRFAGKFDFLVERHAGNVAYLLVLNSMILRVPLALKRRIAPALLAVESLLQPLQGRRLSCFVVGRWRKRA